MTTILFDLDGTLINTAAIVLPTFRETLTAFHTEVPPDDVLRSTFGHPDERIWEMLMPKSTPEKRKDAFQASETRIQRRMDDEDLLLPYVKEVLSELYGRGYTLSTASNCGQAYLDTVLDSQGIRRYFTNPLCLETVNGCRKADILEEHFRHFDKASAVMVGDRSSDIEAADVHGIPTVGCAFGFGPESELKGAALIIHDLRELLDVFPQDGLPHLLPHGGR